MAFKSDGYRTVNEIFQIGADCYVGQVLGINKDEGGDVEPAAVSATACPDTTTIMVGICNAVVTSPTSNSTYKGDFADYDVTVADQLLNDPVGACLVRVDVLFPGDIVCFPLVKDTMGTAPDRKAVTTGSSGATFVTATIATTIDDYSTVYCSKGANRGLHRVVTTAGTATQTVTILFPYTISAGDEMVIINIVKGFTKWDFDSQIQGIDTSDVYSTSGYYGFCHQMELQKSGEEKAYITIAARHLAMG